MLAHIISSSEAKLPIERYQELLLFTLRDKPFVSLNQGVTGANPVLLPTKLGLLVYGILSKK